jgi:hypothetical protein
MNFKNLNIIVPFQKLNEKGSDIKLSEEQHSESDKVLEMTS